MRLAAALALAVALHGATARAQFAPPVNVSQSSNGSYLPSMTRDRGGPDAGTLRVFWHDFTGATNLAWCAEIVSEAPTPGAPCAFNVNRAWTPRAASDSQGGTHVAWRDRDATTNNDDVWYAKWDGVAWSPSRNLSQDLGASRNPVIAVDPWDRPHVVWEDDTSGTLRLWETHFDGSAWSAPAAIGFGLGSGYVADTIRLACDGAGTLHLTWADGSGSLTDVYYSQRPDGGTWSAPEDVSLTPGSYSAEPTIAVSAGDEVFVAWVEQEATTGTTDEICLASRPSGGTWSPRQEITQLRTTNFHPSIAVGTDDVPRVAFGSGPSGDREIEYLASPASAPVGVSASPGVDSDRAVLVLDDRDEPHVAWQEGSVPTPEILYAGPSTSIPIEPLLFVRRSGADVVLEWQDGAPPYRVERADDPALARPWPELSPPGGITATTWTDAGAATDGIARHYLIN